MKNKSVLYYGAGLIALYLVVKNPSGIKTVLTTGPTGAAGVVKAFQGR
jgi:hypothetical protein